MAELSRPYGDLPPILLAPVDLLPSLPPLISPVIGYGPPDGLDVLEERFCHDYLAEPWADSELRYRVRRAAARRITPVGDGAIEWGRSWLVGLHPPEPPVRTALTFGEFLLLDLLVRSHGAPVGRSLLLEALGQVPRAGSRALEMRVSRLRRRLAEVSTSWQRRPQIRSVRGSGYQLTVL
jgi:DNA-binding response OmpR family regulator